jgi:CHAD domain-containing protein
MAMPSTLAPSLRRPRRRVPPDAPRPGVAWIELIREARHRWCAFRRLRTDVERSGYGEPAVHDFRVAAQRFLAALRLAERLVGKPAIRPARRRVREELHDLRRLRDVQVMGLGLPPAVRHRPLLARLRRRLEAEERGIRGGLKRRARKARGERTAALLRAVFRALVAKARASSDAALTRALRQDLAGIQARVAQRASRIPSGDLAALHRLRLAVKRARYALEIVAATHGFAQAKAACRAAQGWQDLLGTIRDLQVLAEELAALPAKGKREQTVLRLFRARLTRDQTEALRTLLRQQAQLHRFAGTIQCLPGVAGGLRRRAS